MDIGIIPFSDGRSVRKAFPYPRLRHTCEVPVGTVRKTVDLQGAVLFEYDGMTAEILYSKIADSKLRTEISREKMAFCPWIKSTSPESGIHPEGIPTSGRSAGPEAVDLTVPPEADEYLCEFREFIDLLERGKKNRRATACRIPWRWRKSWMKSVGREA